MGISPAYTIHRYRDDIYKVVAFKGNRDPDVMYVRDPDEQQHNEVKLDSNFSRARNMVLQYALCNPWDWFFTGTLDERRFNRYDLDKFQLQLSQFIRDKRKVYGSQIQFLLIPEQHQNGAWHIHGMLSGLPETAIRKFRPPEPDKLIKGGFMNWPDYQEKFGFCSLGAIRDPIATAYYVVKYISKDLSQRGKDLGKHLYFHSRPLKKAEKASDVYLYHPQLDSFCINEYDFCKTGMVESAHWSFPYIWEGADYPLDALEPKPLPNPLKNFDPSLIDPTYEQLKIDL